MKRTLAGIALLLGTIGTAEASGFDVSLSSETANLAVLLNPYPLNGGGGSELALGGFVSEEGDSIIHATLMARGYRQSATSQYNLAAGVKLLGGEVEIDDARVINGQDSQSVGSLALGLQAGFLLASSRYNPIELSFEAFYAPTITSFSDADSYSEVGTRLQIEVIPQARAYIGYRRMRFNTRNFSNVTLDRSIHMGLKISF